MKDNFIKGFLYKEIYRNEINGYMVGLFKIKDNNIDYDDDMIHITGILPRLSEKKEYILYGEIVYHNKYGKQFNVNSFEVNIPTKEEELIVFLSSDLFPIGEKTAKKIVDTFHEDTINKILENKDCLQLIPRLGENKINRIYNVLVDYQSTSNIVMELTKLGFDMKDSLSFLNKYNNKILDTVNNNIYELIDSDEMSFVKIDEIALGMGINEDDERRIKALIIYIMKELCFNNGDTYLFLEEISNMLSNYVSISNEKFDYLMVKLVKNKKIIIEDKRYYLRKFYEAEKYICERLCFLNDMSINSNISIDKYINNKEKDDKIKYDEIQKKAIYSGVNNNITIITGGPGTGKTTILDALIKIYKKGYGENFDISLCAPTGRASKRMSQLTHTYACTIHRFLKWDLHSNTFSKNELDPVYTDILIVDEFSMVDTLLFDALLKGIKGVSQIILIGDDGQIPSVGAGNVLHDLLQIPQIAKLKLNKIFRQESGSMIIQLAHDIRYGHLTKDYPFHDDIRFYPITSYQAPHVILKLLSIALSQGYTLEDIQVIIPMYANVAGIDNINRHIQDFINPHDKDKPECISGHQVFRLNDKVLQLKNQPEEDIFNGDVGYIVEIDEENDSLVVDFDGHYVEYTRPFFSNLTLAYAMSVHKAQGSEFNIVFMCVFK